MKLEVLSNFTKATSFHWEDGKSLEDIDGLVERIKATNIDKTIMYNEWQRVEQERTSSAKAWSKRKTKVSKKISVQEKVSILKKKLIKELLVLKDRLIRVHSQYKAFKAGREEAEQNRNGVTIQVHWSENRKLTQCGEEKEAYYYEDHVSLHPIYVWPAKDRFSKVAMGNSTKHTTPTVMEGLLPLLKELEMSGIKHVNVISDSPTSQYRNKGMFWLVKTFCEELTSLSSGFTEANERNNETSRD